MIPSSSIVGKSDTLTERRQSMSRIQERTLPLFWADLFLDKKYKTRTQRKMLWERRWIWESGFYWTDRGNSNSVSFVERLFTFDQSTPTLLSLAFDFTTPRPQFENSWKVILVESNRMEIALDDLDVQRQNSVAGRKYSSFCYMKTNTRSCKGTHEDCKDIYNHHIEQSACRCRDFTNSEGQVEHASEFTQNQTVENHIAQCVRNFRSVRTVARHPWNQWYLTAWLTSHRLTSSKGSGKTTLLNCMAGRSSSMLVEGEICFNDSPATPSLIKERVGYVMQNDHLLPNLTVRETLQYAALLRLPNTVSHGEKLDLVRLHEMLVDWLVFLGGEGDYRVGIERLQRDLYRRKWKSWDFWRRKEKSQHWVPNVDQSK